MCGTQAGASVPQALTLSLVGSLEGDISFCTSAATQDVSA